MVRKIFAAAVLLALVIFLNNSADAKIKKYTDEQGTLHITNMEPGEEVQAPGATKRPAPAMPMVRGRRGIPTAQPQPEPETEPPEEAEETPEETPPEEDEVPPDEQPPPDKGAK